jgi:hypothetical protein
MVLHVSGLSVDDVLLMVRSLLCEAVGPSDVHCVVRRTMVVTTCFT